jgi:hypothetical protein
MPLSDYAKNNSGTIVTVEAVINFVNKLDISFRFYIT